MSQRSEYGRLLLDRLLGVDGPAPGETRSTQPVEQVAPSGPATTTVDTGAPNQDFLLGITQTQVLGYTFAIVAAIGALALLRKVL